MYDPSAPDFDREWHWLIMELEWGFDEAVNATEEQRREAQVYAQRFLKRLEQLENV